MKTLEITNHTIIAYSETGSELGYWFGANNSNPDDSIGGGDPFNFGTKEQAEEEMRAAESFAKSQGWAVSFRVEKL